MNKSQKSAKNKMSVPRKIITILGVVALLSGLIFVAYFFYSAIHSWQPNTSNYQSTINNKNYTITDKPNYIAILPSTSPDPQEGLIIYQGAFADAKAYIAPYSNLTYSGVAVFIVKSPLGFALFNVSGANQIIKDYPNINKWYVAGHSLGGVAACEYAKSNTNKINGLILLGSFCNGNASELNTKVLSISASKDGLSTTEKINNSRTKLPKDTKFVIIQGGNHSQFGDFEKLQPGDNVAEISANQATSQINDAIINFIK